MCVTAPPVDGRANEALTRLLAARLGVANGAVEVVGGHTARRKLVAVDGLSLEADPHCPQYIAKQRPAGMIL